MKIDIKAAESGHLQQPGTRKMLRAAVALFVLWWALLLVFYLWPDIDLSVAGAFFEPGPCTGTHTPATVCGSFPWSKDSLAVAVRKVFFYIPAAAGVLLLGILVDGLARRGAAYGAARLQQLGLSLAALLLGPYVLVNLLLKSFSGRPRPYQTDLFGGDLPFVPAGSFMGQCDNNCSFISGEAAGAGWVACLLLFLPAKLRPVLAPPILVVALVTPAMRIAFGGHYLSDVVLGWLSSLVVFTAVFAVFEIARKRKIER
ncbi:phosphatase PAP2 family protein [Ciceribacter thiooxidans]|uniref:Phosphatase PAP2 family protein n=1 Tax=Ciceribacter thiooxidans TaxID=1969821 RepID=A0ABV7I6Q5_9HYPH|nr:phosphatase PAP2 family protein [Ciceribacter thiooxidans]